MTSKTSTPLHFLIVGYWRKNSPLKQIVALYNLIKKFIQNDEVYFPEIDKIVNSDAITITSVIRCIQRTGNKIIIYDYEEDDYDEFASHIMFKTKLENKKIYQYDFSVNHHNEELLIGLINDTQFDQHTFRTNWWASADVGLALDIESGFFVTQIAMFTYLSESEYINWKNNKKLNKFVNKDNIKISLRINRQNNTVRYYCHDVDLGIAYHLESDLTYCIAITLTTKNQWIRLLEFKELQNDSSVLNQHDLETLQLPHCWMRLQHQHNS